MLTCILTLATLLGATLASPAAKPFVPGHCNNTGLQWALYHPISDEQALEPELLKTKRYLDVGTTEILGNFATTPAYKTFIYGSKYSSTDQFGLLHTGYIYTQLTGTYVVTIQGVDDIAAFWIGSVAFSKWTFANANATAAYDDFTNVPGFTKAHFQLKKGRYVPFRVYFGNLGDLGSFGLNILGPSETQYIKTSGDVTNGHNIVTHACNEKLAPPFPPYGPDHDI